MTCLPCLSLSTFIPVEKLSVSPLLGIAYPNESNPYILYQSNLNTLRPSAKLIYEEGSTNYTDVIFSKLTFQRR